MPEVIRGLTISGNGKTTEVIQVRRTGDWSSDSKLAAIANGLWEDPYFHAFNGGEGATIPNRTSLICYGYYVRFRVCDYFIRTLILSSAEPIQVVSLGAGMDTLFFRLLADCGSRILRFFDVDFPSVIARKGEIIETDAVLLEMSKGRLFFVPGDLRAMDSVGRNLVESGFDLSRPAIFYSECVVNYLAYGESDDILRWIVANVPRSVYFAYEQANPNDSFGRIMVDHFQKNGCPILSVKSNGRIEEQFLQLQKHKFKTCQVMNAWDAFIEITKDEPSPIAPAPQLQFDEYEALIATCLHYSVRIGQSENILPSPLTRFEFPTTNTPIPKEAGIILKVDNQRVLTTKIPWKVKGHASLVAGNKIYVIGGTNQGSALQRSITRISCSTSSTGGFKVTSDVLATAECFGRNYATAVFSESTASILVLGGRRSPANGKEGDAVQVQDFSDSACPLSPESIVTLNAYHPDSGIPFPRWRHAATVFTDKNGEAHLFLFGGKLNGGSGNAANDVWTLPLDRKNTWKRQHWAEDTLEPGQAPTGYPSKRHSHAICTCPARKSIFVVGGISVDDTSLCQDALWEYRYNCPEGRAWKRWTEFEREGRKVGHKIFFHGQLLHIVGGYGNDSDTSLSTFITTINFDTSDTRRFQLELGSPHLFLPFDFSAHVLQPEGSSEDYLLVFGGGGNCFSFGSHYNTAAFLFKLPL